MIKFQQKLNVEEAPKNPTVRCQHDPKYSSGADLATQHSQSAEGSTTHDNQTDANVTVPLVEEENSAQNQDNETGRTLIFRIGDL